MKFSKKHIIALIVVVVAGGFIALNIFNASRMEAAEGIQRNAPSVQWAYPSVQTIVSQVSARGNVELRDRTIVFPETQAQIVTVHVSVGDEVRIGDVLITYDESALDTLRDQLDEARLALRSAELGLVAAQISPSATEVLSAENQVETARASIASSQAQVDQLDLQISQIQDNIQTARNSHNDVQMLFNNGVATRTELDSAANAVRTLEDQLAITQSQRDAATLGVNSAQEAERLAVAQLGAVRGRNTQPAAVNQAQMQQVSIEQAQLRIAQIERSLAEFEQEERAAVAGTVLNVFVEEGEFSATGRPLLEIADVSSRNLVIVAHVPENDAGGIEVGQKVEISGGALGGHTYEGRLELIHPLAAPQQIGTVVETVVTAEIAPIGTTRLRAGNTVDADIITSISEDTLVVPLMSTVSEGGGVNFVYVIGEGYMLERRDIILGEFSNMYIEAIGVRPDDMVVISPNVAMFPGMHVRPVEPIE